MLQLKNQSNPNSCIRVDDFDDNNDDVDAKRGRERMAAGAAVK